MIDQSVHITPATPDQRPLIANLIQLYLYDMTESMPFPVGPMVVSNTTSSTASGAFRI